MVLKGTILPDHIPLNKYVLSVLGLPAITFTELSGINCIGQSGQIPGSGRII